MDSRDKGGCTEGLIELPALTADCSGCKGFCCTELYFSKLDGFPADKPAGVPCSYLTADFRCGIHSDLFRCGLKGCAAYDCFGAGQRAAGTGADFHRLTRLHQMLWYLSEAAALPIADDLRFQINALVKESSLISDLDDFQARVNAVLKTCIAQTCKRGRLRGRDFIGTSFRKFRISDMDFSFTLLIAADFTGCTLHGTCLLGADLRDAKLQGADLSKCLFLTQMQLNGAKGDQNTLLPSRLKRPEHWKLLDRRY